MYAYTYVYEEVDCDVRCMSVCSVFACVPNECDDDIVLYIVVAVHIGLHGTKKRNVQDMKFNGRKVIKLNANDYAECR